MTGDLDRATSYELNQTGFDDGLRALLSRGWRFQQLHDDAGQVVVFVGSYGWPDYYDRLHVYGEDDAIAARVVMDAGSSADEIVWSCQGDATKTVHELLALPKPHDPNAPRLASRAPLGLWLPSTGLTMPPLPLVRRPTRP
jgi:hypothetical protein